MASPEHFAKKKRSPAASRNQESFPVKLMHILQLIDTKEPELAHIISWQPNGTMFRIHDKKLFEKLVKQRGFFNQKSYSSFRRQLNLWGFKKIGKRCAEHCGVYGHPMFLRDNPRLSAAMNRKHCELFKSKQSTEFDDDIISSEVEDASTSSFYFQDSLRAVTESTKSIDTVDHQRRGEERKYFYYNNIRKNPMIEPMQLDEKFIPLPSKYGVLLLEALESS
ncbi:hypothetical protein CTEN210_11846 [Chaetoceros tenuissimus]|uniref:HSF-type DNA-binding domain-containing protein n=1 Tax=Chaetoceros tenuissimus TaxID=426638 RepID=A0AAD3H9H9_9STRA|nr:hypothetical protein CTEN210_11846 [Chaetoceros tenuissimus]